MSHTREAANFTLGIQPQCFRLNYFFLLNVWTFFKLEGFTTHKLMKTLSWKFPLWERKWMKLACEAFSEDPRKKSSRYLAHMAQSQNSWKISAHRRRVAPSCSSDTSVVCRWSEAQANVRLPSTRGTMDGVDASHNSMPSTADLAVFLPRDQRKEHYS